MTSLSYDEIFSKFLDRVTDYDISSYEDEVIEEIFLGYLKSVISQPYIRQIFSNIKLNNYDRVIEFDSKVSDYADEFVLEVLSRGMVVQWLEPQVKSKVNIAQMFGGKEQNWYSQAQHLSQLKDMLETEKIELRKLIRDRGSVYNPYLKGK